MSLTIDYYTDVLCIWAWIAQRRIDELEQEWGDKIELHHHYINLFGDTRQRMEKQWSDRGGYEGFAEHVQSSAAPFDTAPVNHALWRSVKPLTSANAHLILKAIEISYSSQHSIDFARVIRKSFFVDGVDIGPMSNLFDLSQAQSHDTKKLKIVIDNGEAMAALMADYHSAQEQGIKGSPSWVMNNGRQVLYGNVGYRVLSANVEELLRQPEEEASWC